MAFHVDYDPGTKVLQLSFLRTLTDFDLLAVDVMLRKSEYPLSLIIVDYTDVMKFAHSTAIYRYVSGQTPVIHADCPIICIAPGDLKFGLARAMQAWALDTCPNVHVARTRQEAAALIDEYLPGAKVQPIAA
jgi:hypothetical protein